MKRSNSKLSLSLLESSRQHIHQKTRADFSESTFCGVTGFLG